MDELRRALEEIVAIDYYKTGEGLAMAQEIARRVLASSPEPVYEWRVAGGAINTTYLTQRDAEEDRDFFKMGRVERRVKAGEWESVDV